MPASVSEGSVHSAGSNRSKLSRSSYRVVGRGSNVDESLFGSTTRSESGRKTASPDVAIIKKNKRPVSADADPEVPIVISSSELSRIKAESVIVTREEMLERKKRTEQEREEKMAAAKARKERMLRLEEERKKNAALSELEVEQRHNNNTLLEKAQSMLDEDLDEVKHMNQMMLYSKCVTIRDAQIAEKQYVQRDRNEEEKRLDILMEIERLKALKMYEEREKKRIEDRRRGADIISQQIRERERDRIRQQELQDQEREQVLKQIELLKLEEMEAAKAKKEAGKKLLAEVAKCNTDAIRIKQERLEKEREEDMRISQYIKEREQREREHQEELARIKAEKEMEVARLRAMQEKAQDKQAELDALRAKRAIEAAERAAREKERKEMEKIRKINQELAEAREAQKREKERRMAEQARIEREEFERIIQVQKQFMDAERKREEEELMERSKHSRQIREQIVANEEIKKQSRRDFLEEGNIVRMKLAAEKKKLEAIKEKKLRELRESGVPEKYCAELARKKITVG